MVSFVNTLGRFKRANEFPRVVRVHGMEAVAGGPQGRFRGRRLRRRVYLFHCLFGMINLLRDSQTAELIGQPSRFSLPRAQAC
jgi:hypothetical protein